MKGIILAGGAGSRLYPLTRVVTKQLQPIYDKPMIYYPLSLLMMCGIKDILIITTEFDQPFFKTLLGDGSRFGISITFEIQAAPKGIAEAYLIAESFLAGSDSLMILGDNLFHGNFAPFRSAVKSLMDDKKECSARIFAYPVSDPERYGVVEFDSKTMDVVSIEEKPSLPKSNHAIPGLYLFDGTAPERAKKLKASDRGELEIIDLIKSYLNDQKLKVELINRGMAWLDTGTPQSLLEANSYIAAIEQRQGLKVACLEEVGLRMNFLSVDEFDASVADTPNSPYKDYLLAISKEFKKSKK